MSKSTSDPPSTTKLGPASDTKDSPPAKDTTKASASLEEDDEFEDFPQEDWETEDTELPGGNAHLWEESWDDDTTTDDFAKQLKEEIAKADTKSDMGKEEDLEDFHKYDEEGEAEEQASTSKSAEDKSSDFEGGYLSDTEEDC